MNTTDMTADAAAPLDRSRFPMTTLNDVLTRQHTHHAHP